MQSLYIIEFKPSSEPAGFEVHYMNTLVGYFIAVEGHEDTYFLYDSQLCNFAIDAYQQGTLLFTDDFLEEPKAFASGQFFRVTACLVSDGELA